MGPYLLKYLCQEWERSGHDVIYTRSLDNCLSSVDVLFMHIDLTVIPSTFVDAVRKYPVTINRNVVDISKHTFSNIMLQRDQVYDGPVIVKTSCNYGGLPEYKFRENSDLIAMLASFFGSWRYVKTLRQYKIYDSVQQVPYGVWSNQNLIVEKFLPELTSEGSYCVREWVFLGDQDIHYMSLSKDPIIKSTNTFQRVKLQIDHVPLELRTKREELGFDYGKFDYVIHNGQTIIYDINKTPSAPGNIDSIHNAKNRIRDLSRGIAHFMS